MSTSTQGENRKSAHSVLLKHSHNVRKREDSDFSIYGPQVPYSECVNAMNELAAIRAVAFAEWIANNEYQYNSKSNVWEGYIENEVLGIYQLKFICDTHAELYKLFIQDTENKV